MWMLFVFQPFKLILYTIRWIVMELVIQWSKISLMAEGAAYDTIYEDELESDYTGGGTHTKRLIIEDEEVERKPEKEKERIYRACDKKANLYILQQNLFIQGGNAIPSHGKSTCSRLVGNDRMTTPVNIFLSFSGHISSSEFHTRICF